MCPFPNILHVILKMEATRSSETLVSYHSTQQSHNSEDHDLDFWKMSSAITDLFVSFGIQSSSFCWAEKSFWGLVQF